MRPKRSAEFCLVLSLVGLGVCLYLGFLHLSLLRGDLSGGRFCGDLGSVFDCHATASSPFGSAFGMPLAFWGIIGYLATLSLSLSARQFPEAAGQLLTALTALSLSFLAVDAVLLVVMIGWIGVLCPLCLITYGLNLGLALAARGGASPSWPQLFKDLPGAVRILRPDRQTAAWFFWGVVLTGLGGAVAVNISASFLSRQATAGLRELVARDRRAGSLAKVDTQGDPVRGNPSASIRIVEFTDFLCPICQKSARFNELFLRLHRNKVSLVIKHFPMDQACNPSLQKTLHPGACQLAEAAECAHEQGKFFEFHDRLFRKGPAARPEDLEQNAFQAGLDLEKFRQCLAQGRGKEAVRRDVAEGNRLGVQGTPAYVINGSKIAGALLPSQLEELAKVFDEEK